MSSIITIQNRIEELSSAIERQKQILRDLEISRSDARRELNAARDPMGRLPVEISSDIFMRSLPDYYSHPITPSFYDAPVLFLRICHLWSEIALATPSLWAEICFDFDHDSGPNATDSKNRLARWIARAGTFPLNLSLGGHLASGVDIIQQYAHRMPTLDLRPSSLKGLGQISFSSLLALRISGYTSPKIPLSDCIDTLRAAPLLVECEFALNHGLGPASPFLHNCLRHLRLGKVDEDHTGVNSSQILQYLTLPALESLVISSLDISDADFASFLTRSSSPLRSLRIAENFESDISETYMRLVPGLTELLLKSVHPFQHHTFDQTSAVLPNLLHLTVCAQGFPSNYDGLIRWCTYHTPLASLRIILPEPEQRPSEPILAALRQFKENGTQVYVGVEYEEINYMERW